MLGADESWRGVRWLYILQMKYHAPTPVPKACCRVCRAALAQATRDVPGVRPHYRHMGASVISAAPWVAIPVQAAPCRRARDQRLAEN